MAVAFGGTLGTNFAAGPSASVILTTTGAVPSGGKVIVCVGWWANGTGATASVAGGGLSWTQEGYFQSTSDADARVGIFSANAPSGLASSTALTATFTNGNTYTCMICGCYATGLATSSFQDGAVAGTSVSSGGTGAWNSGTLNTTNADDLLISAGWLNFHLDTSTTTAPFTEWADFQNTSDTNTFTAAYRIVSATGAYQATGTWSGGSPWTWLMAMVGYKAAASAAQQQVALDGVGLGRW